MNWDAVSAIGELLGLVAVVVSLLYLARQVRQNTMAVKSTTQQKHLDAWMQLNSIVVDNPDVAGLIRHSLGEDSPLEETARIRFEWLAARAFALFESVFADVDAGLLEPTLAVAYLNYYGDLVRKPGFERFWKTHRSWYYDDFADHLDREVFAESTFTRT